MSLEASNVSPAPQNRFFDQMKVSEKVAIGVAITALVITILGSIAFGVPFPHIVSFMNNSSVQMGLTVGGGVFLLSSLVYLAVQYYKKKDAGKNLEEKVPENPVKQNGRTNSNNPKTVHFSTPPNSTPMLNEGTHSNPVGIKVNPKTVHFPTPPNNTPILKASSNQKAEEIDVNNNSGGSEPEKKSSPRLDENSLNASNSVEDSKQDIQNQPVEDGKLLKTEWYSTGENEAERIKDDGNCAYSAFMNSVAILNIPLSAEDAKILADSTSFRRETNDWIIKNMESDHDIQDLMRVAISDETEKNIGNIKDRRAGLMATMRQPFIEKIDEDISDTIGTIEFLKGEQGDSAGFEANLQTLRNKKEKIENLDFFKLNLKYSKKFTVDEAKKIFLEDIDLENSLKLEQKKQVKLNDETLSFEDLKEEYMDYLERCKDDSDFENRIFANTAQYHAFAKMFSFSINLEVYVDGDPQYFSRGQRFGDENAPNTIRFLSAFNHIELLLPRK